MSKKSLQLFSLCLLILFCFCPQCKTQTLEPAMNDTINGRLGHPLGTILTISGFRMEKGKIGTQTLRVEEVNGSKLQKPIGIWIENLTDGLPKGLRCILTGRETGRWIGGEADQQAIRQFYRFFIVDSVRQPSSLKITTTH